MFYRRILFLFFSLCYSMIGIYQSTAQCYTDFRPKVKYLCDDKRNRLLNRTAVNVLIPNILHLVPPRNLISKNQTRLPIERRKVKISGYIVNFHEAGDCDYNFDVKKNLSDNRSLHCELPSGESSVFIANKSQVQQRKFRELRRTVDANSTLKPTGDLKNPVKVTIEGFIFWDNNKSDNGRTLEKAPEIHPITSIKF
jgi:hypothetical protein